MIEIWKEMPWYSNIYEVSTQGKARTVPGKTTLSVRHGTRVWKQRIFRKKPRIYLDEAQ